MEPARGRTNLLWTLMLYSPYALGSPSGPQAQHAAPSTESCRFWMIKADFIRAYSDKKLPFFQEMRSKHPGALVEVTITYAEVVSGTHVDKILSISHRWMTPEEPDPDGEQLKAIKTFLKSDKGREIELIWIDGGSMPQDQPKGSRSAPDTADFKMMLSQVRLHLTAAARASRVKLTRPRP